MFGIVIFRRLLDQVGYVTTPHFSGWAGFRIGCSLPRSRLGFKIKLCSAPVEVRDKDFSRSWKFPSPGDLVIPQLAPGLRYNMPHFGWVHRTELSAVSASQHLIVFVNVSHDMFEACVYRPLGSCPCYLQPCSNAAVASSFLTPSDYWQEQLFFENQDRPKVPSMQQHARGSHCKMVWHSLYKQAWTVF